MEMIDQNVIELLGAHTDTGVALKIKTNVLDLTVEDSEVRLLQQQFQTSERVAMLLRGAQEHGGRDGSSYDKWLGGHWVMAILADFPYPLGDERLLPLRDQQLAWLFGKRHQDMLRKLVINGRQRRCASQEGYALFSHIRLGIANERVHDLAEELMRWQWPDGGWNCDKNPEAQVSSFNETLIPLRALIAYAKTYADNRAWEAARKAAEVFLVRRLYLRLKDSSLIEPEFIRLHYPCYWHYDILFALKVLSEANWLDDPRCQEALDLLVSKRTLDGGFPAESNYTRKNPDKVGFSYVDWGGTSIRKMNPWVTADALTVLKRIGRL